MELNRSDWWLQCWLSPSQICTHTLTHSLCSNPLRVQPEVLLITFTHMLSCTCTPLIWLATASHTRTCFTLTWPLEQWSERSSLCFLLLNCTVVFLLCTGSAALHCTNAISAMPSQYNSLHYKLNCYCFEFSYDTCPALRKSFIWYGSLLKIPPDHYVNKTDISYVVEYLWGLNCLSRKRTYR